jgi:hypothetical protein
MTHSHRGPELRPPVRAWDLRELNAEQRTQLVLRSSVNCYPCPRTIVLPMYLDRTQQPANIRLQRTVIRHRGRAAAEPGRSPSAARRENQELKTDAPAGHGLAAAPLGSALPGIAEDSPVQIFQGN